MSEEDRNDARSEPATAPPRRQGPFRYFRTHFLAGVLVVAPIGLTLYFVWLIVNWVDQAVTPHIPVRYNPETYLPFHIPGLGLVVVFIVLTLIGWITRSLVGRFTVLTAERILNRMPVIRGVYGAMKQIFETILSNKSQAFREVVLVEYPRRDAWTLGFITGRTEGEVRNRIEDEIVNVYIPTTPNPTSGFLLFVPRRDVVVLAMTVDEGIKMIISTGLVTPPDRRPTTLQETPTIRRRDAYRPETGVS
ncbi:MAG: DUF502 domain-containing protein [Alphaproteobacteria bacterium]|nr:DUF502 domain-containing protein [Alphaproteobacteria bacterium]